MMQPRPVGAALLPTAAAGIPGLPPGAIPVSAAGIPVSAVTGAAGIPLPGGGIMPTAGSINNT